LKFDSLRKNVEVVIVGQSPSLIAVYEKYFALAGLKVIAKFSNAGDLFSVFASDEKTELENSIIFLDSSSSETRGLEFARQLKQLNPRQKVILLTDEDLSKFEPNEGLFDGWVRKPFTFSELLDVIDSASSPLRMKGSWIFKDPPEIERLLRDILLDSKEKMCSVRNPASIIQGINVSGHTPSYIAARAKGLKVFLITEITKNNLFFCKQLMVNQGVQLRHLEGVQGNFIVWDARYTIEIIQTLSNSPSVGQALFSNLESIVSKNQYEFDQLWNIAIPAERKIQELDARPEEANLVLLSGNDVVEQTRINLVRDARIFVDACLFPGWVGYLLKSGLLEAGVEAISRGVRCRLLTEITRENVDLCKKLIERSVEIRHLSSMKGAFALNEKELTINAVAEDRETGREFSTIYSKYPDLVAQHKSIFNTLWQTATLFDARVKELEEESREQIQNN